MNTRKSSKYITIVYKLTDFVLLVSPTSSSSTTELISALIVLLGDTLSNRPFFFFGERASKRYFAITVDLLLFNSLSS